MAATADQAALILSVPKRKVGDETQETLRTSAFPTAHVKVPFPLFPQSLFFFSISCTLVSASLTYVFIDLLGIIEILD